MLSLLLISIFSFDAIRSNKYLNKETSCFFYIVYILYIILSFLVTFWRHNTPFLIGTFFFILSTVISLRIIYNQFVNFKNLKKIVYEMSRSIPIGKKQLLMIMVIYYMSLISLGFYLLFNILRGLIT